MDSVAGAIIDCLLVEKSLSTSDIYERIPNFGRDLISLPTLYRRINQMIEQQTLVRYGRKIEINPLWLAELRRIVYDQTSPSETEIYSSLELPSQEGEEKIFQAQSLSLLDPIWNSIHYTLASVYQERDWYGYNSDLWFDIGMSDTESRLRQNLVAQGSRYSLMVGNNNWLNQAGLSECAVLGTRKKMLEGPKKKFSRLFSKQGHALWSGKNYIIECLFPSDTCSDFEDFFSNVNSSSDLNLIEFQDIFKKKSSCSLRVRRSAREAKNYRELLAANF